MRNFKTNVLSFADNFMKNITKKSCIKFETHVSITTENFLGVKITLEIRKLMPPVHNKSADTHLYLNWQLFNLFH